jgi:hypothetical protein
VTQDRTSEDWFQEAARCYLENHQGCAWCGGAHRVYQVFEREQLVYYCSGCDFRAGYDNKTESFFSFAGEPQVTASKTMCGAKVGA